MAIPSLARTLDYPTITSLTRCVDHLLLHCRPFLPLGVVFLVNSGGGQTEGSGRLHPEELGPFILRYVIRKIRMLSGESAECFVGVPGRL